MPVHVGGALDYALRQLHENPDDPKVDEMQFDWLNTAKDFVAHWGMWRFLEDWGTISVPSSGIAYFPNYVWSVVSIFPGNLGYRSVVDQIGAGTFDEMAPGVAAGLSSIIANWGWYGVQADVSTQGVLTLASDAAGAGDEGVQIIIEGVGITTARYDQFETVTLNASGDGTTAASWPSGAGGVRRVTIIYDSLFTAGGVEKSRGILTVTDAGSAVIARIDLARQLKNEHIRAEFFPSNQTAYIYRMYRRMPDIITLDHTIDIPTEFKDAFHYALMAVIRDFQGSMGESMTYEAKAEKILDKLRRWEIRRPGMRRGLRLYRRYRSAGGF